MESKLIVSAQVMLYVNGSTFSNCSGFDYTTDTPRVEKYGIDSLHPFELVPAGTSCSGSLQLYRRLGDGGAAGAGIVGTYSEVPKEKYFSLALLEIRHGLILFEANRCSCLSETWGSMTKDYLRGRISFKALEWSNEIRRL